MISIITPIYNGARFLAETIESVQRQTETCWELLLVDDGSSDNSFAIAQGYAANDPRIRAFRQENGGVVSARNTGFCASSPHAEFVIFLDHDDVWLPHTLSVLLALLRATPDASASYGLALHTDQHLRPDSEDITSAWGYERWGLRNGKRTQLAPDERTTFDVMVQWPCFSTPGQLLIRRRALEACGLFDPQALGADDWELAMRLSLVAPLAYTRTVVLHKRQHDHNAFDRLDLRKAGGYIRRKLADPQGVYATRREEARFGHQVVLHLQRGWAMRRLKQGSVRLALANMRACLNDYLLYRTLYKKESA